MKETDPHSRDPETLIREMDAKNRIHDMKFLLRYREQLQGRWYDSGIVLVLFISGLGILITISKLLPSESTMLYYFVFCWFALFVLSLIATLEILLSKIEALRKLYLLQSKTIEDMEKQNRKCSNPTNENHG